mgnify:CR=1 FL=1
MLRMQQPVEPSGLQYSDSQPQPKTTKPAQTKIQKLMIDLKLSTDVYDLRDAVYAILKELEVDR